jgi:hypothetical protein
VPHVLTPRFADAVAYAAHLHRDQVRKVAGTPYVAHLLGAAAFVLEQRGTSEDQAIAALLHDALEDQPDQTSEDEIARRYGPDVARMVRDCTDADVHPKRPWRHRKVDHLVHLQHVGRGSLQVALADKLHNARAILTDLQVGGASVWSRFSAPPVAQRWYYSALAAVFRQRLDGEPLVDALVATFESAFRDVGDLPALRPHPDRPDWVGAGALTAALPLPSGPSDPPLVRGAEDVAWQPAGGHAWRGQREVAAGPEHWWAEPLDAGDPIRPLAVFVAPERA